MIEALNFILKKGFDNLPFKNPFNHYGERIFLTLILIGFIFKVQ